MKTGGKNREILELGKTQFLQHNGIFNSRKPFLIIDPCIEILPVLRYEQRFLLSTHEKTSSHTIVFGIMWRSAIVTITIVIPNVYKRLLVPGVCSY